MYKNRKRHFYLTKKAFTSLNEIRSKAVKTTKPLKPGNPAIRTKFFKKNNQQTDHLG
jgi:hypothetical protein